MWLTLWTHHDVVDLWPSFDAPPPDDGRGRLLSFRDPDAARWMLRTAGWDFATRDSMRRFALWTLRIPDIHDLDDSGVEAEIARRLARGTVLARARGPMKPLEPKVEEPPRKRTEDVGPTTTWIEIQVVWDDDGKGIGDLELRVATPDGEEKKATTNADGILRLDKLPRGACSASADFAGAQMNGAVAVAGMGERAGGPAKGARKDKPKVERLIGVERHRVRTGETLENIAASEATNWKALARFNFGTDDKEQVIRSLLHRVGGCYDRQLKQCVFSDEDEPGILYVPRPFELRGLATSARHVVRVREVEPLAPFFAFSA